MANFQTASKVGRAVLTRLVGGAVSLLFISFLTFVATLFAPDAAIERAGEKATLEQVERIRHNMGLDRPWPIRYGEFLSNAAHFDFGNSYSDIQEPVNKKLARVIPLTARIALLAILLAAAVGITLGTIAGIWQSKGPDRLVLSISTLGVTLPNFVLAPLLVYFFAVQLNYLPTTWAAEGHRSAPDFYYLLLPVLVLAMRPMASLTRLTRASMIDTLQQEFIRLAIAKGVPPFRLYIRHALRNAILPVITAIGTSFGFLLTGSFVVETVFAIPGFGYAAIDAISRSDTPMILASTVVSGAAFVIVNLFIDILAPFIDPRIRESQI